MNKKNRFIIMPPEIKLGFGITFASLLFFYLLNYFGGDKIKEREIRQQDWYKRWIKRFKDKGIKTISFVLDDKYISKFNEHGSYWRRVEKVYVNNKKINPDSLYRKEDFIVRNCDNMYYYFTYDDVDSVIYQFYPAQLLLEKKTGKNSYYRENKVINKTRDNSLYKIYLPRCWD